MKNRIVVAFALFLGLAVAAGAQTAPAPAPNPLATAWNVSVNGGFSSITNAGTNNGFFFSSAVRMTTHLAMRGDVFVLNDPAVTVTLAKPELRFDPFYKSSSAIAKATEIFLNAGVGDARFTDPAKGTKSKFAWGVGGGFDVRVPCGSVTCTIRPLDATYLRSSLLSSNGGPAGIVIGNHLQFAAGLGLRF